ncbi:hypothetical protein B0T16DRAFT_457113 [Cercophora newfieldiana]|uniref:Uncharacterized protein n=1 Tax=Cercophora newfieldiana TaxID=92897 RepID=A0AA39YBS4_9PEZI|nr:hypothetical protein B0T16DRAFT_457113 [Cercophora newfieldiana]
MRPSILLTTIGAAIASATFPSNAPNPHPHLLTTRELQPINHTNTTCTLRCLHHTPPNATRLPIIVCQNSTHSNTTFAYPPWYRPNRPNATHTTTLTTLTSLTLLSRADPTTPAPSKSFFSVPQSRPSLAPNTVTILLNNTNQTPPHLQIRFSAPGEIYIDVLAEGIQWLKVENVAPGLREMDVVCAVFSGERNVLATEPFRVRGGMVWLWLSRWGEEGVVVEAVG